MITLVQDVMEVRSFTPEDASDLFALIEKNRQYLREWLAWLDHVKSIDASQKFIEASLAKEHAQTGMDLGIWHEGNLVGAIGYHDIQVANKKAIIGYWLDSEHQGKGIITSACMMVISFGFEELKLNRIEIKCAPGNTKSSAIPRRLGFKKEGRLREVEWLYDHFVDHDVYSMLSHEWKSR